MPRREDIQIRDPFIVKHEGKYYMYGTTDRDPWRSPGVSFLVYVSKDLENFDEPITVFTPPEGWWGKYNFWAPEVHKFNGKFYMFASFLPEKGERGTSILVSDVPEGPFLPIINGPVTPKDWGCLDGTLYVDESGEPWIVFCHEWLQIGDGTICAQRLKPDMSGAVGAIYELFAASSAPWARSLEEGENKYVTDGPFVYKMKTGELCLLWSSFVENRIYALAMAKSLSGKITGPWVHEATPIYDKDGGHGMVFESFDGQLYLSLHKPNDTPNERPQFIPLIEQNGKLAVKNI